MAVQKCSLNYGLQNLVRRDALHGCTVYEERWGLRHSHRVPQEDVTLHGGALQSFGEANSELLWVRHPRSVSQYLP
jgi:hypothetical protein